MAITQCSASQLSSPPLAVVCSVAVAVCSASTIRRRISSNNSSSNRNSSRKALVLVFSAHRSLPPLLRTREVVSSVVRSVSPRRIKRRRTPIRCSAQRLASLRTTNRTQTLSALVACLVRSLLPLWVPLLQWVSKLGVLCLATRLGRLPT